MSEIEIVTETKKFMDHVDRGLRRDPKKLSSKYFYDDRGSKIFQEIMALPEYYLTNAEDEILRQQSPKIIEALNFKLPFNVIELGAGDGAKTLHLLRQLTERDFDFDFIPIDISQQAIDDLVDNVKDALPNISMQSVVGDYFQVLEQVVSPDRPNVLLFLGSNIGNYEWEAAQNMLHQLHDLLNFGDHLLIGFDLKKDPNVIRAAYSDNQGITKEFNLNLLMRINRELDGDFNLEHFDFYSYYDPISGEVRSFIVSLRDQDVHLGQTETSYPFAKGEVIHTELSRKYSLEEVHELAIVSGFEPEEDFQDSRGYFADALWRCIS